MKKDTMRIHVWPDRTWCDNENLEDYLTMMSDDYKTMDIDFDRLELIERGYGEYLLTAIINGEIS